MGAAHRPSPQYPRAMRETFHAELSAVVGDLVWIVRVAGQTMTNASISLHQADLRLAEFVISRADEMKAVCDDMDQRCLNLLVRQAPLATDLRAVAAAMADLSRVRAHCDGQLVADHERLWAKHQTLSAAEHVAAARALRRERIGLLRPAPQPAVEIRALADYDTALGIDDATDVDDEGGVA